MGNHKRKTGFTLIEALVAVAILSLGIVVSLLSLGSLSRREATIREQEYMQRLAQRKFDELLVTSTDVTAGQNGDFKDWSEQRYSWTSIVDTSSGVTNLDTLIVTVVPVNDPAGNRKAIASGLVYVAPQTSTTTTGATTP